MDPWHQKYLGPQTTYINPVFFQEPRYSTTFVLSTGRGPGKTVSGLAAMLLKFKATGERTLYLRRYQTEVDTTAFDLATLSKLAGGDVTQEHAAKGESLGSLALDGKPAILLGSLNKLAPQKSTAYPQVSDVIFDEFIDLKNRSLKREVSLYLQLMQTVYRDFSQMRSLFFANTTDRYNPYFLAWKLRPLGQITKQKATATSPSFKIVMLKLTDQLYQQQATSDLGKLLALTSGVQAVDQRSHFDEDTEFIQSSTPQGAKFAFRIQLLDRAVVVRTYQVGELPYLHLSHEPKNRDGVCFALRPEEITTASPLIPDATRANLVKYFQKGRTTFDSGETKASYLQILIGLE